MYQCTIQRKVWVEFVTANASGQLTSAVALTEGNSARFSAAPSGDAICWAWKSSDLLNKCRFWKHICYKKQTKKQSFNHLTVSPMTSCTVTQGEECLIAINQYRQALHTNTWPTSLLQLTSYKNYHLHLQQQLRLLDNQDTYCGDPAWPQDLSTKGIPFASFLRDCNKGNRRNNCTTNIIKSYIAIKKKGAFTAPSISGHGFPPPVLRPRY